MTLYKIHLKRDSFDHAIMRLSKNLTNMKPVFQDIGEYMTEATKARFRVGRGPDGVPWRAKSPTTLAAYKRRGDGAPTKPLIGPTRRLSSEIHYRASSDSVLIGSSLIYAAVQQFGASKGQFGRTERGGPIPWGNIPARPFLGIDRDDERNIVEIVEDHYEDVVASE